MVKSKHGENGTFTPSGQPKLVQPYYTAMCSAGILVYRVCLMDTRAFALCGTSGSTSVRFNMQTFSWNNTNYLLNDGFEWQSLMRVVVFECFVACITRSGSHWCRITVGGWHEVWCVPKKSNGHVESSYAAALFFPSSVRLCAGVRGQTETTRNQHFLQKNIV